MNLNNLALIYYNQGKHAKAEPLYRRTLAILQKALGPEHPSVATVLENYAILLRETDRNAEADKLKARARAIRSEEQERPHRNRRAA
jgi:tetratricopeptide (TPR) repeat protein